MWIRKIDGFDKEALRITFKLPCECTILPYFEKGTMYKGMEVGKKYTPKELGLKCKGE